MDPRRLGQAEGVWTESQRSQDSNASLGNLLAVQWLGLSAFTAVTWVPSVVGELRSHK